MKRIFWSIRKIAIISLSLLATVAAYAQGGGSNASTNRTGAGNRQLALVIGNAEYPASPLQNPVNDAAAVSKALRQQNFNVSEYKNLNARDMRRAISNFGDLVNQESTVVFYFAGHGIQSRGHNYLIPVDAEIKKETAIRSESIDLEEIMEYFAQARTTIVVLDACRNNPFERRFRGSYGSGLAQIDAPKGTLIAYATAPGKVALDGDDKSNNGIYTGALVKAMQEPGLKIEEVFKRARVDVSTLTKDMQIPWESSSLTGDFCFGGCTQGRHLTAEIERLQNERETELRFIKREKDLLQAEKALAEKQRQILETELREKNSQHQAAAEKFKEEKAAISVDMKKLLDEYQKRIADEVAARARAEEEARRLGNVSSLELAKLKREKELLENERALAEKQRQILENQLREKSGQQQELSNKLLQEKDALASERQRIVADYERKLAEEASARVRAEDEAKKAGVTAKLASAQEVNEAARLSKEIEQLRAEKQKLEDARRALSQEVAKSQSSFKAVEPRFLPSMF